MIMGQEVKISEEISIRNDNGYQIIGEIDGKLLLFEDKQETFKVLAYDGEMESLWDKKIDLGNKRSQVLDIISDKSRFIVIYKFFKKGKNHIKALAFNSEADTISSEIITSYSPRINSIPQLLYSDDKSKLILYDSDFGPKIYTSVFDIGSMKSLFETAITIENFEYDRDFVQTVLDNNGNAYFIIQRDNKKAKRNTSRFEVISLDPYARKDVRYNLSMKGKLWLDVQFVFDNKNQRLTAAGLYSNKRYGEANGYFFTVVDPNRPEDYQITMTEFDSKFITTVLGKELKRESGFGEVSVQDLILRRDGGVLMIAERNKRYTRRATSYNSFYNPDESIGYQVDYHYNDILLISIHPTGQVHWKELLRKRQYSQDDKAKYSSYFLFRSPSSLRFLYNDEIKQDTNINEYVVLADGQNKRKSIMTTNEEDLSILFRDGVQISLNELIVPSERRGDLKLVKFIY